MDTVLSELIDLLNGLYKENEKFEEVGVKVSYMEELENKIEELIMDLVGLPEDTTVKLGVEHPDVFCRDYYFDWIIQFSEGKLSKEKLIFNLKNWKSL